MSSSDKPYKGRIEGWYKKTYHDYADYTLVWGTFKEHPEFAGHFGHTSYIMSHDEATGEIETRNSRYTLGEPAK